MPEEPFMLVSLDEAKAKKLANVLGSPTATKLLNALTKGKATETELAKSLSIPLSTVHYNLQQLREAKLVLADEYHYSSRGREVLHYRLANKYIIIAPQEEQQGFLEQLKRLLPAAAILLAVAGAMKVVNVLGRRSGEESLAMEAAPAIEMMQLRAADVALAAKESAVPLISDTMILLFLAGGLLALLLIALFRRKK